MKLKIAKTVFFVGCVAAFIFLLLPFLETTPPPEPAQLKAQPQVATDNPLTALAQRFASLFGRRSERRTRAGNVPAQSARTTQEAAELYTPMLAASGRQAAGAVAQSAQPVAGVVELPAAKKLDFGDASIQTDNGEWVLVRQTAPAGSRPGMHEVNAHDNPYDRFIRQERAQHFQPQKRVREIPDSKWARFIRPIKQFFGLDQETPVSSAGLLASRPGAGARSTQAADGLSYKTPKPGIGPARLGLPDISARQWMEMSIPQRERYSVAQFNELITGTRAAEEAAEMMAEAKYPDAHTKKQKEDKERYKQEMFARNKQAIKQNILQQMDQLAQGKEPVDDLSNMMGCHNASLPAAADLCDPDHAGEPAPATPQEEIKIEQQKNAATFFERTKYYFPKDLPITPVLGPTDPETLANSSDLSVPVIQKTLEVYDSLHKQQHCDTNTCYLVPNSTQMDPQLTDAITMTNGKLKPDPENLYPTFKDEFVRSKAEQFVKQQQEKGAQVTKEQLRQLRKEAAQQYDNNAPHYIPYTAEQLKAVQTKSLAAVDYKAPTGNLQNVTALFVMDPALVSQVARDVDSVAIGYNLTPLPDAITPSPASEQFTGSIAQDVENAKAAKNDIIRQASQQYMHTKIHQSMNMPVAGGTASNAIAEELKGIGNQDRKK